MALLLVNMVAAVFGTDFEERISSRIWIRNYFNEVIYRKDRNIIVEYQPYLTEEENIIFYNAIGVIFWFDEPSIYQDCINWTKFDDSEYGSYISICGGGFSCKVKELNPDLYELEIEDVRISQEKYEDLLKSGHDMKFALNATEPGYSLYFQFAFWVFHVVDVKLGKVARNNPPRMAGKRQFRNVAFCLLKRIEIRAVGLSDGRVQIFPKAFLFNQNFCRRNRRVDKTCMIESDLFFKDNHRFRFFNAENIP